MNLQTIGIIGAGTMGNGIAQVCAVAGINVTLLDICAGALEKALATVGKNLEIGRASCRERVCQYV